MTSVFVESPYAGDVQTNLAYLRRALLDSFKRGEAPFASHALYTQVLDDLVPEQRALGLRAGEVWRALAQYVAVYDDLGISPGMQAGIDASVVLGKPILYRRIGIRGVRAL